jgi:hypothetical protein
MELSLIARVRRGEIHFERLVDVLSTRGYIVDTQPEDGLGFGRVAIDQARQEDFDALFAVLMPGQTNDIQLMAIATDQGSIPGVFTNALFNRNVIDYETMKQLLVQINREEARQYG